VAAEDGNEYFFHQSACNGVQFDDLQEGQAVTFEKGQGPKGPRAEDVRPA
jgi:CspA family cold shock protein